MSRKYQAPDFLVELLNQQAYERWLERKARAHVKRDRKRGNTLATGAEYKSAIHSAVVESKGNDYYTGEALDWSLLCTWNNDKAKERSRQYKKEFELLPSIDHVGDGLGAADFKICSWRTNDCKNDLTYDELKVFCENVLRHAKNIA